jgi:Domain of unknown function DUF29
MDARDQHDVDFYGWTREQAARLRAEPCEASSLDLANLAEEIEDMGRSEIREISSLLHQTLAHLLKIAVHPDAQSVDHWFNEILTFQGDAVIIFAPGLRQRLDLDTIWRVACNGATRALGRNAVTVPPLPKSCPLTLDQLLDPEFDPDQAVGIITSEIEQTPASLHGKR